MSGPVAKEWAVYRRTCVPPHAGPVQVEQTRRAFYCGALALFHSILGALSEDREPMPEDFSLLEGIDAELKAFTADLERQARAARGEPEAPPAPRPVKPIGPPRIDQRTTTVNGVKTCHCFHAPEEHLSDGCGIVGCPCVVTSADIQAYFAACKAAGVRP